MYDKVRAGLQRDDLSPHHLYNKDHACHTLGITLAMVNAVGRAASTMFIFGLQEVCMRLEDVRGSWAVPGGNYQLPLDVWQTFRALCGGLQALETDLHEHIHLEYNILFPVTADWERPWREA